MKIYLSPSMQFYNKYAFGNTTEANECHKIATACYNELVKLGFDVKLAPLGQSAEENVKESNGFGADYHICIHTNAGGGKGNVVFVTEKNKDDNIAKAIYEYLDKITLYKSVYGVRVDNFYEMKYANAKCVYVECEFHDDYQLAAWIVSHTEEIGETIAKAISVGSQMPIGEYNYLEQIPKAYAYTRKCVSLGIIKGKADGLLHFTEALCRCVEICCRVIVYVTGKEI